MNVYQKIDNLFKFDTNHSTLIGYNEPYATLKDIEWEGTEKVDGTNVRVFWDGYTITLAGRTDKAEFPKELLAYLQEIFLDKKMEYIFEQLFKDKKVYLFGEGYGSKIQNGGDYSSTQQFILFDVNIDGYDLDRQKINEIATQLGLTSVPVVFNGTLDEAVEFIKKHPMSTLGNHKHEMEGLVLVPKNIQLYDKNHNLVKCKVKYRDFIRGEKYERT